MMDVAKHLIVVHNIPHKCVNAKNADPGINLILTTRVSQTEARVYQGSL